MPRALTRAKKTAAPDLYDCSRCPAYCCSIYGEVRVTRRDLRRLADHLGLTLEKARARHTQMLGRTRVLRRKKDPVLGRSCSFLDPSTRRCQVYEGRPEVCREYPGTERCAYYDVLQFEQQAQGTKRVLPLINITFPGRRS